MATPNDTVLPENESTDTVFESYLIFSFGAIVQGVEMQTKPWLQVQAFSVNMPFKFMWCFHKIILWACHFALDAKTKRQQSDREKEILQIVGKRSREGLTISNHSRPFLDYQEPSVGQVKMTSYLRGFSDKNRTWELKER